MLSILPGRSWEGLPQISKYMYEDTYFLTNEDYSAWVERMVTTYSSNHSHKQLLTTMFHNYWFHPSTPISSNGGTSRGLPISCYVGDVEDSKSGIFDAWTESCWLGAMAGGIGRSWNSVRELGSEVANIGKSSGIIPFMCVDDALSRAISQGGVRRMSQADYLDISHPEIEEFIDIRKPTGDQNRRAHSLHHGISIPDSFMQAVISNSPWNLISPKSRAIVKTVSAQKLWHQILELRSQTGEPYLFFYDNVNNAAPSEYKRLGLDIHLSNLCTEIMLNTAPDKTNVCCLASLNLEYWDEFSPYLDSIVPAAVDFLDNVLTDFITRTLTMPGFERARNAAIQERAIGLGVMGFHSLLQKKHIPFESSLATGLNKTIFRRIREASDNHQLALNQPCPLALQAGTHRRNIVTLAIAPTMSISNLCNLSSSGIEPWLSNAFTKKLKQGSFPIQNKFLSACINNYAATNHLDSVWVADQWLSIKKADGSVQHLDWLDPYTKDVFKTAFELDQRWLIDHASTRNEYIDQGQSINLFIYGNSHVQDIADLHTFAWKRGLKSLYYLRSTNPNRASTASTVRQTITYDECLSCT